jgi:glucose uptake protein GlcU
MNFDPSISTSFAVIMGLFAAFMWGSWFISLKYLDDYPLEAFYVTLFSSSLILVWGVAILLDGKALFTNLISIWHSDKIRIIVTIICGILYASGMQFSLRVVKIIGLSISQPLQASINMIGGTLISGILGGIPEGMTVGRIAMTTLFLSLAIILTMKAGRLRNSVQEKDLIDTGLSRDPKKIRSAIILVIIGSLFTPAYSTALSFGLKSITQPNGLAVMPFMAMLCTGAFIGSFIIGGISLTVRKEWHKVKDAGFKIHKFGIISGFAHYGGNIIHTFATRNLSSVVAWPLGITAGIWTQTWGLLYGEFKGSTKITYVYLFLGVACYLFGALLISRII